jgi:hypothetical protein
MLYTSSWAGFELVTLVVIGIDCIGSCKSNYYRKYSYLLYISTYYPVLHIYICICCIYYYNIVVLFTFQAVNEMSSRVLFQNQEYWMLSIKTFHYISLQDWPNVHFYYWFLSYLLYWTTTCIVYSGCYPGINLDIFILNMTLSPNQAIIRIWTVMIFFCIWIINVNSPTHWFQFSSINFAN